MCAIVPAIATGLSLFSGLAMRSAAQQQANQTYETEVTKSKSAEEARNLKVQTAGQNTLTKEAENARQALKARLATDKKVASIEASGLSGNLLQTLTGESEREGAEATMNLNRSNDALRRNLGLQVRGYDAELGRRRAAGQSNINQAYAKVPSMTQTLLGVGSKSLTYDWSS